MISMNMCHEMTWQVISFTGISTSTVSFIPEKYHNESHKYEQ
jgi:hypothetical protein